MSPRLPDLCFRELRSKWGIDDLRTVVDSSRAALERIASLVEEDAIGCDFARIPAYLYSESPDKLSKLEEEVEAARDGRHGPPSFVRAVPLPFPVAAGRPLRGPGALPSPLKYLASLARTVHHNGGRIHERTRVMEVEAGSPAGCGRSGARSRRTRCSSPPTPGRLLPAPRRVEPLRSYVLGVKPRSGEPPEALLRHGGPLPLHAPARGPAARGRQGPQDREDHKPEESYRALEEYVRQHWDVASIDYRWSAQFYDPPDGLPMIGRALTSGHVFVATGYSGVGMVFGTLGGMLLADFALERENPWAKV